MMSNECEDKLAGLDEIQSNLESKLESNLDADRMISYRELLDLTGKAASEVYSEAFIHDWMMRMHFQATVRVAVEYLKDYEGRDLSRREQNIKMFVTKIMENALAAVVEAKVKLDLLANDIDIEGHPQIPQDESATEIEKQYQYLLELAEDDDARHEMQREWEQEELDAPGPVV